MLVAFQIFGVAAVLFLAFFLLSRAMLVVSEFRRIETEFSKGELHYFSTLEASGLESFAAILRRLDSRRPVPGCGGSMTWLSWAASLEDAYTTLAVSGGPDADSAPSMRRLSMWYPGMLTALWSASGSADERLDLDGARQALASICRRIDSRLEALAEWDALSVDDRDVLCSSFFQRHQLYGLVPAMGGRIMVAAFRAGVLVLKKSRFLSKWKFGEFVSLDDILEDKHSALHNNSKVNFADPAIRRILLQIPHARGRSISAPQLMISAVEEQKAIVESGRLARSLSVGAAEAEWAKMTEFSLEDTCEDVSDQNESSELLMIRSDSRTDLRRENRNAVFSPV